MRAGNFVISRATPTMFLEMGASGWGVFLFFGLCTAAAVPYVYFLLPETKSVPYVGSSSLLLPSFFYAPDLFIRHLPRHHTARHSLLPQCARLLTLLPSLHSREEVDRLFRKGLTPRHANKIVLAELAAEREGHTGAYAGAHGSSGLGSEKDKGEEEFFEGARSAA